MRMHGTPPHVTAGFVRSCVYGNLAFSCLLGPFLMASQKARFRGILISNGRSNTEAAP